MLAERETLEPSVGAFSDSLPALVGKCPAGHVTLAFRLLAYTVTNKGSLPCRPPRGSGSKNLRETHKERVALSETRSIVFLSSHHETSKHLFSAPSYLQSLFLAISARLTLIAELIVSCPQLPEVRAVLLSSSALLIAFIAFSCSLHLLAAIASDSFSSTTALAKLPGKLLSRLVPLRL